MPKCFVCKININKNDKPHTVGFKRYCGLTECRDQFIYAALEKAKEAREKKERAVTREFKKKEKKKAKAWAKKKRDYKANDVKVREPAARKACHLYIRERDRGSFCICCGKPLDEDYHAGHFFESGNNSGLRYDEDNIHAQNVQCNFFKGGDSGDYERHLRMKIGDERVDNLRRKRGGGPVKRTAEDYKVIEVYYNDKLAKLIDDRGY